MVQFQQADIVMGVNSPNCNYYGELDDSTHIFVTCSRLS